MKNLLIHGTLRYSVAIAALKTSRVKLNSDVLRSHPDGRTEEIVLPYAGAPLLALHLCIMLTLIAAELHYKVVWQP